MSSSHIGHCHHCSRSANISDDDDDDDDDDFIEEFGTVCAMPRACGSVALLFRRCRMMELAEKNFHST